MKISLGMLMLSAIFLSCTQESPKVKHVKMKPAADMKGVSVVNEDDPVCHMKTAEFLKDTAVYHHKVYGFCSDHCKSEFKKNPASYVQN